MTQHMCHSKSVMESHYAFDEGQMLSRQVAKAVHEALSGEPLQPDANKVDVGGSIDTSSEADSDSDSGRPPAVTAARPVPPTKARAPFTVQQKDLFKEAFCHTGAVSITEEKIAQAKASIPGFPELWKHVMDQGGNQQRLAISRVRSALRKAC